MEDQAAWVRSTCHLIKRRVRSAYLKTICKTDEHQKRYTPAFRRKYIRAAGHGKLRSNRRKNEQRDMEDAERWRKKIRRVSEDETWAKVLAVMEWKRLPRNFMPDMDPEIRRQIEVDCERRRQRARDEGKEENEEER